MLSLTGGAGFFRLFPDCRLLPSSPDGVSFLADEDYPTLFNLWPFFCKSDLAARSLFFGVALLDGRVIGLRR